MTDLVLVDDGVELCVELVEHGDDLEGAGRRRQRREADDVREEDRRAVTDPILRVYSTMTDTGCVLLLRLTRIKQQ